MPTDANVANHYSAGGLLAAIESGLQAMNTTPDLATVSDLAPVDEFHVGGRQATTDLCQHLGITAESTVLDVGCGIGGPARFMAADFGCQVTGLDLTPEYVEVAEVLTEWTGLSDRVSFRTGGALRMPFDDNQFDRATQLHVGMNISDKAALFAEIHRVLVPGGRLGVYDIMGAEGAEFDYPVPWAADRSISFTADAATYRRCLQEAGFTVDHERNRRDFAIEFFAAICARSEQNAVPSRLGLQLIMGPQTSQKISNMVGAIQSGSLAPVEMICVKGPHQD